MSALSTIVIKTDDRNGAVYDDKSNERLFRIALYKLHRVPFLRFTMLIAGFWPAGYVTSTERVQSRSSYTTAPLTRNANSRTAGPSSRAVCVRSVYYWTARTLGSWVPVPLEACILCPSLSFCVVLPCVGWGLVIGRSPAKGAGYSSSHRDSTKMEIRTARQVLIDF
jgi:hypothetical protein